MATGLSFAFFGLGQLVLGIAILPLLRLLPGGRAAAAHRTRSVLRHSLRLFIWFMREVRVLTFEFSGAERLGYPGQLIIANHPSLLDVVFLLAFVRGANCVVKAKLWHNPFAGFAVRGAGYIRNVPTAQMIDDAATALATGQTVIVFPEGTRTQPGEPACFHRGAASIAIRTAAIVSPVFIAVRPTVLTKGAPWYRVPWRRPHFSLRVGEGIAVVPYQALDNAPQASRKFNERLLEVFSGEIGLQGTE